MKKTITNLLNAKGTQFATHDIITIPRFTRKPYDLKQVYFISTFIILFIGFGFISYAQVSINTDGSAPDASAMLDVKSTSMGIIFPRLTNAERDLISSPAIGLLIYNTDQNGLQIYDGTVWNSYIPSWECGNKYLDDRNGQIYSTVQIGDQCWMVENINVGTRINGSITQPDNGVIEKYCYDNNESNCDLYGGLYQWDEAMQHVTGEGVQGVCPPGWHVPTDTEWCILENRVDAGAVDCNATGYRGTDAGYHLKYTSGWNTSGNGDNSFGFAALAGGFCSPEISSGIGDEGQWWSSSISITNKSWRRFIAFNDNRVFRFENYQHYGFSVRCLKD